MQIEDSFQVARSIRDTWNLLLDFERIAPCMPGAELQRVDADDYYGSVSVKVGPMAASYDGKLTVAEVDQDRRRMLLRGKGRETRGMGSAEAEVIVSLHEGKGSNNTEVAIECDMTITGTVAQFGRGVINDVASKIIAEFASNLERDVLGVAASDGNLASETTAPPSHTAPNKPVDLLELARAPIARRLIPVGVALVSVAVVWLAIAWWRR